jgi:hypothetical protein
MFQKYNYELYSKELKEKLRYIIFNLITDRIPYAVYSIPYSIATVEYYLPIIYSYMIDSKEQVEVDKIDRLYFDIISQFIKIRLLDLFVYYNQQNPEVLFPISITSINPKIKDSIPNGFTLIPSILGEQISRTTSDLMACLSQEEFTKDIKFSLTDKDEKWGDIPPYLIKCIHDNIFEELNNNGLNMVSHTDAIYSKNNTIEISYNSNTEKNSLMIVCFTDVEITGEEQSLWAKTKGDKFSFDIPLGSIIVIKNEALYNWKYSFNKNKGILITK